MANKPLFMTHLLLSHLSKNNNDPQLVQELFDNCANGINIIVASRYVETEVYYIGHPVEGNAVSQSSRREHKSQQISLF
jgi:hypothetical protein